MVPPNFSASHSNYYVVSQKNLEDFDEQTKFDQSNTSYLDTIEKDKSSDHYFYFQTTRGLLVNVNSSTCKEPGNCYWLVRSTSIGPTFANYY